MRCKVTPYDLINQTQLHNDHQHQSQHQLKNNQRQCGVRNLYRSLGIRKYHIIIH